MSNGLQAVGWGLVRGGDGHRRLLPTLLPSDGPRRRPRPGDLLPIELDRITSTQTFSFRPGGWHPYVGVLEQWQRQPTLTYGESVLATVHRAFVPRNLAQVVVVDHATLEPSVLDQLPPLRRLAHELWSLDPTFLEVRARETASLPTPKSQHFGPVPAEFGARQLERLQSLYRSVEQHGYHPERSGERPPSGYFLVDGDDWRFVLRQGHHRVAVLRLLGHRHITAEVAGLPWVVNVDALDAYTNESGGPYPRSVAERLFRSQFDEDGRHRLEVLDLTEVDGAG